MEGDRNRELWDRIQELLDLRRDPLHDPEIQEELLRRPGMLEEVVRLQETLRQVAGDPPAETIPRSTRRPVRIAVVLIAGVAATVLLWITLLGRGGNESALEPVQSPASSMDAQPEPAGTIVSCEIKRITITPEFVRETVWLDRGVVTTTRWIATEPGNRLRIDPPAALTLPSGDTLAVASHLAIDVEKQVPLIAQR